MNAFTQFNQQEELKPTIAALFVDFEVDLGVDVEAEDGQVTFSLVYRFDRHCYVSAVIKADEKLEEEYVDVDGNPENDRPTSYFVHEIKRARWADPAIEFAIVTDSDGVAVVENQLFQLTNEQTDKLNELLAEQARTKHFEKLKEAA